MIEKTIREIEARLQKAHQIDDSSRAKLLSLMATLKTEVSDLSSTQAERAQSIAGFAQVSAHELIRKEKNPHLVKHALDGFAASVTDLENSHPKLVEVVNRICVTLSNLGI